MRLKLHTLRQFIRRFLAESVYKDQTMGVNGGKPWNPYTHSYAWIDPQGEVFLLEEPHSEFGYEILENDPDVLLDDEISPTKILMKRGWIPIRNIWEIDVLHLRDLRGPARRSVIEIFIQSAQDPNGRAKIQDAMNRDKKIFLYVSEPRQSITHMSIDEFLGRFATREEQEQFWAAMMGQ
jgi:hypothetical protein